MVDIEECSLRAFKQDLFSALNCAVKIHHGIGHEWTQVFAGCQITFVYFPKTDRLRTEALKDSVVLNQLGQQLLREHNRLHQSGHAQASARRLVAIGWADPTLGGSNAAPAQFALLVEHTVVRQDQMSAIANEQVLIDFNSQFAQTIDLGEQRDRIDNNPISNHANFAASED